jgi:hypothetical protein
MDKEQKSTYNLRIFRIILVEGFSIDEMKLLAADVCGDHELIIGEKAAKEKHALDLLAWCRRNSKLDQLAGFVQDRNPTVYQKHQTELTTPDANNEGVLADMQTSSGDIKQAFDRLRGDETASKPSEPVVTGEAEHPLSKSQEAVRRWFLDELSVTEQAFVVSAALFNGLQRHDLMEISSVVQNLLEPGPDQGGQKKEGNVQTSESEASGAKENVIKLTISLEDGEHKKFSSQKIEEKHEGKQNHVFKDEGYLLELANLTTEMATKNTEGGQTTIRVIQFRNEAQRKKIIYLLANHFTKIIWKLVPLIRNLGAHLRAEVRAQAARIAGELLREVDFIRIKDELLIPWALSPSMDVSLNVGIALEEGAKDKQYISNIKNLLKHWVTSSNPDLNWTALASYIQLNQFWPDEAINAIDSAIKKENNASFLPLCNYLLNELCKNGYYEDVIYRIVEWMNVEKKENTPRFEATLLFLGAVEFSFFVKEPALMDKEVEIFRIGLSDRTLDNLGIIRPAMLEKLCSWSKESFGQSSQVEIEKLFTRLFLRSDERGKERIKFSLQKWCRAASRQSDHRLIQGFENLISALPE